MTSGSGVKYKGSIDCAVQVIKNEGHVLDEGSWCQYPPWCCWCRCLGWFRQIQCSILGMEIGINFRSLTLSTHLNSPSPFTSLIYENVFGLKPGGLINLIYIYKQS